MRETIAVDVDEVLFPFADEFIKYHNGTHGTELAHHHLYSPALATEIGVTELEAAERIYTFHRELNDATVEPLTTAREAIGLLAAKYTLVVITARNPEFQDRTTEWLAQHFPDTFKSVNAIGHYNLQGNGALTKAKVCQRFNAIALIDDSLGHVRECAKQGMQGILFGSYPWNQANSLPPGVTRCLDWESVLRHLDV
jgi:5'(3')-deoxyribonucleotidase